MRILGIDPGLGITGYGVIEAKGLKFKLIEAGIIRSSYKVPLEARLYKIYQAVNQIVRKYKPKVLVLEKLYSHYKHPTTAILMGHARGIICLAANLNQIPVVGYSNTRLNKAVIGRGNASKGQIQRMVQSLLGLKEPPNPLDISDALALAICYVYVENRSIFK
jgi:crossover junction endodeoxyribonuclease RuvC